MAANKETGCVENCLVPVTTHEVTVDWFQKILNIKIDSSSFSTVGNVNAGVGFLSNLVRVRFEETLPDACKQHCLAVKLLPFDNAMRQLVIDEKMDMLEINFYQNLVPEIVNENPLLAKYFCPFIYGRIQEEIPEKKIPYASVLVLRDLKPDGYIFKPFNTEVLSNEEIGLTIDFLANFHAASTFLEIKKQVSLSEIYNFSEWFYPNERKDYQVSYHSYFIDGFKSAKDVITDYTTNIVPSEKTAGEEIIANLIEPFAPFAQKILNEVMRAGKLFPSLIHGDLWQNNLLMTQGTPQSIKIIDWQTIGYTDSTYDLAMFLITSLHPDLNFTLFEKRARLYFDSLEKIYTQKESIDLSGKRRRSWDQFWQTIKTFGATFVFIINVMHCVAIAGAPENYPKIYDLFHFYHYEADLASFLKTIIK